ncbi:hypothetical protein [Rhabdothermincola salaria]|uniref:hypothetical protein n=1 Tax=Rhabdothermincola salaria TaxID=2903142 RepID=UPI001E532A25|nr:hypothetical protein [Rhabdothermincola salaria]MCD9623731.1 hypothetical protein [Rhabdothermincola salaria]
MTDPAASTTTSGAARPPRRLQPRHAGYVALVAVAAVALYFVYQLAAEDGGTGQSSAIEQLYPTEEAQILQQDRIGIDLAPGYEGSLALNGDPLPDDEVMLVPELNQVFYQPGPGQTFESWPAGRNCIIATFWRSETGPGQSSSRAWCFTVV